MFMEINDEVAIRRQLVKAVRMLERIGILDMNGHFSFRLPKQDRFLINARAASRASLTVEDIVSCDLDGRVDEGMQEPPSEVHIHAAIYQRRPDVSAVIHSHPHWQTVLGIAGHPLRPVFSIGAFTTDFPVFEKSSLVNTRELAVELAETLGTSPVVQIRHHGNVVVGSGIEEVFAASVYLEENAKKQFYAASINADFHVLEGENLERTRESNWAPSIIRKAWRYQEEKARLAGSFQGIDSVGKGEA